MNEWEAKYKALLMGIDNPEHIENAEKLVRVAVQISSTTDQTLENAFWLIVAGMYHQRLQDAMTELREG